MSVNVKKKKKKMLQIPKTRDSMFELLYMHNQKSFIF